MRLRVRSCLAHLAKKHDRSCFSLRQTPRPGESTPQFRAQERNAEGPEPRVTQTHIIAFCTRVNRTTSVSDTLQLSPVSRFRVLANSGFWGSRGRGVLSPTFALTEMSSAARRERIREMNSAFTRQVRKTGSVNSADNYAAAPQVTREHKYFCCLFTEPLLVPHW